MPTYSPKDVVRIKREIQALSEELVALGQKKQNVCGDISTLNLVLDKTRQKVKSLTKELFSSFSRLRTSLKEEISSLQSEIITLQNMRSSEKKLTEAELAILRTIRKNAEEKVSRIQSEASVLDNVLSQIEREKAVLDSVIRERKDNEVGVLSLKQQEQILLNRIAEINDQLKTDEAAGRALNAGLASERDQLRRQIENSRGWERDVRAMEVRLTPQYQEVFKRMPSRKQKNNNGL